jgi:hypothetical protein
VGLGVGLASGRKSGISCQREQEVGQSKVLSRSLFDSLCWQTNSATKNNPGTAHALEQIEDEPGADDLEIKEQSEDCRKVGALLAQVLRVCPVTQPCC